MNYTTIPQLMRDVAMRCILPHFYDLQNCHIAVKRPDNTAVQVTDMAHAMQTSPDAFVTTADLAAEEAFRVALASLHPGRDFVGEESFLENGSRPIRNGAIVDPIDGTRYFANGSPDFGSMLAFLEDGHVRYAAIYQPCADLLLTVEAGQGGQGVRLDGQIIAQFERTRELIDQITIGHFDQFASPETRMLQDNLQRQGFVTGRHVCSSMDYLRFARGEIDNMVYKNAYPWDIAAGALLVKELGGRAALLHSEQDLTADLFSDIQQVVLMTRYWTDWKVFREILLQ